MRRDVVAVVVDVYESPVHNGYTLEEVREDLAVDRSALIPRVAARWCHAYPMSWLSLSGMCASRMMSTCIQSALSQWHTEEPTERTSTNNLSPAWYALRFWICLIAVENRMVRYSTTLERVSLPLNEVLALFKIGSSGLTEISLIRLRGEARQVAHMMEGRDAPVDDDHHGEDEAAQGIKPPDLRIGAHCAVLV